MATAIVTAIDGSTAMEGSMATATAMNSTEMEISTAKLPDSKELWRLFGTSRALTYVGLPASLVLRASEYISKALCTLQAGGLTCVRAGTSRALTYV